VGFLRVLHLRQLRASDMIERLIVIPSDSIMWEGNQIGFFIDQDTIEMSTDDEDLENGEFTTKQKADLLANLSQIEKDLIAAGYKLVRNETE
jgi:hypothetical protein